MDDPRVIAALQEYLAALRGGRELDRREFLGRHPDIADELAECLDGLAFLQTVAPQLRPPEVDFLAAATGPATDLGAGASLGDFRILREVGRGGMGVVYEAEQRSLGRRVALKVLPFAAALDARQLRRFKKEAQAAACLHHTNIVPVFSVGCEHGVSFYAMQFIEGQTLAAVIAELRRLAGKEDRGSKGEEQDSTLENRGPGSDTRPGDLRSSILDLRSSLCRTVAQLGVQAAEALEHAHDQGVVHRDIKPANLLVEFNSPSPLGGEGRGEGIRLWVTDFGLAQCHAEAGLTLTGDVVGTLRYMSPEQALGKRGLVDQRTDIYSLGLTLYELLTLRPALTGQDRQELLRQIALEEPAPPRRLNKAVPVELETILLKAMAKDPAERYATAQELADDLRRFLEDRPIQARRPTWVQRAVKWSRRHKAVMAAAAGGLVVAVAVLAVSSVLLWLGKEETERALEQARANFEAAERQRGETEKALEQARTNLEAARHQERLAQENAERADANRRFAEEKYLQTWRGFDKTYTRFAVRWLRNQPLFPSQQRDYLLEALAVYEEFAAERSSNPVLRARTALACARSADIRHKLGETKKAEEAYHRAVLLQEELTADFPDEPDHRRDLAHTLNNLGVLLENGRRLAEAEKAHRRALGLRQKLADDLPAVAACRQELASSYHNLGVVLAGANRAGEAKPVMLQALALREQLAADSPLPDYRQELASTQHNLGLLLVTLGQRQQAEPLFRQALVVLQKLADESPAPAYRSSLAGTYSTLGSLLATSGRPRDAEKAFRQAIALWDKLAVEVRTVPAYRQDLATSHANLGNVLTDLGRTREADEAFQRGLTILQKLVEDYPDAPRFREFLATAHNNLGTLLSETGRAAEAEKAFREALAIRKKLAGDLPQVPEYRQRLAYSQQTLGMLLANVGRADEAEAACREALALLEKLVEEFPDLPECRHRLATCYIDLGKLLQAGNRLAQAEQAYRRALDLEERLAEQFPAAEYLRWLVSSHSYLGTLLANTGQAEKAEKVFRQALAHLEKRADDFGDEPAFREQRASVHNQLGTLLLREAKHREAEQVFRQALAGLEKLTVEFPRAAGYQRELAAVHANLGHLFVGMGRPEKAEPAYRQALRLNPANLAAQNGLAWLLATCADDRLRNAEQAVELAKKAVERAPRAGVCWRTLGAASYRAGDWKAALAALEKSVQLRAGGDASDWFFLAMTCWQLGDKPQARQWYDKALRWMEKNKPQDEELRRFRAEADALLDPPDSE